MRDLMLRAAGLLGIFVAIGHGVVAEWHVFAEARVEPQKMRDLLRIIWQASTVDWIVIGVLLIAAPALGSQAARQWIIAAAVVVYGYAAVGNAVATQGQHIGWLLAAGVVGLALLGL